MRKLSLDPYWTPGSCARAAGNLLIQNWSTFIPPLDNRSTLSSDMPIQKATLLRFGGVGLAVAAIGLIRLQQVQAQRPPREPLEVQKVTDHLWVILNNGGDVAVMTTDEGVLVVDDKFEQDGPDILAKVKAISDKPVKFILNTHHHGDHTGSNAFFMKNKPAQFAGTPTATRWSCFLPSAFCTRATCTRPMRRLSTTPATAASSSGTRHLIACCSWTSIP